ncbi:MAG: sulfotransferase domain-containing protein [Verrucomicrobiota bacterium]
MITAYCKEVQISRFSLFEQAFRQGVTTSDVDSDAIVCLRREGYVHTGFRHFPTFDLHIADGHPVILLVRDPRDMLVSKYFSIKESHHIPNGQEALLRARDFSKTISIDDWVVRNSHQYVHSFNEYTRRLKQDSLTVFRYEDYIYNKVDWLGKSAEVLRLPIKKEIVEKVAERYDFIPESEVESEHVRQVHPGDHRDKLSSATITNLNDIFESFMRAYDYS